jgi:hypothetical protein
MIIQNEKPSQSGIDFLFRVARYSLTLSSGSAPPFMRKEYTRLLMAVNDAKEEVKASVRPYHRRADRKIA